MRPRNCRSLNTLVCTIPPSVAGWDGTRPTRENRAYVALQDPTPCSFNPVLNPDEPTQSPAKKVPWLPNPLRGILQNPDVVDGCTCKLNPRPALRRARRA